MNTEQQARELLLKAAQRIVEYGFAVGLRDNGTGHCALGALDWALDPHERTGQDSLRPAHWWIAVEALAGTAGATNAWGANCAVAEWSNASTKDRVVLTMYEAAHLLGASHDRRE